MSSAVSFWSDDVVCLHSNCHDICIERTAICIQTLAEWQEGKKRSASGIRFHRSAQVNKKICHFEPYANLSDEANCSILYASVSHK